MEVIVMLINKACRESKLTKKAIEYYEVQGLIKPRILENGYRDYSSEDAEKLNKIGTLRKLGLSVSEIKVVLKDPKIGLCEVSRKKSLEIEDLKIQQKLIETLEEKRDWEYVRLQLDLLEQKQSILERLLNVFPGYYGKYVSLHFASYLQEPIETLEQQEALEKIITFLDQVNCVIPRDLQEYLEEVTKNFDVSFHLDMSDNLKRAFEDTEKYMIDNKEILEQYMAFKESDEYKESPAYKLQELFRKFNQESGYNDIFIPAMKKLSKSYKAYYSTMEEANKIFLKKYPQGSKDITHK